MPGGLMQLTFTGDEDLYLNENPEITFLKKYIEDIQTFHQNLRRLNLTINKNMKKS